MMSCVAFYTLRLSRIIREMWSFDEAYLAVMQFMCSLYPASIQRLVNSGVVEHWYRQNLPNDPCPDAWRRPSSESIKLETIALLLFILGGGLLLSAVVLTMEVAASCVWRNFKLCGYMCLVLWLMSEASKWWVFVFSSWRAIDCSHSWTSRYCHWHMLTCLYMLTVTGMCFVHRMLHIWHCAGTLLWKEFIKIERQSSDGDIEFADP